MRREVGDPHPMDRHGGHFCPIYDESDTPSVTRLKCSQLGKYCKGASKSTSSCRVAYQSKQHGPISPEPK